MKIHSRTSLACGTALLLCLSVAGCARHAKQEPASAAQTPAAGASAATSDETGAAGAANQGADARKRAEASFEDAPGVKLSGQAKLKEVQGGVQIEVEVENAPSGAKGVHIHQKGDCSDIPGKSMGEHYAVTSPHHGLPTESEHHLGDLGNIDVGPNGEGNLIIVVPGANLEPGQDRSFVGKAIVVHESEDVGVDPSGNSGKPIACAVVRAD
ncbi:MAG: superoxide dismutase family protein [Myxococcales bacterium]